MGLRKSTIIFYEDLEGYVRKRVVRTVMKDAKVMNTHSDNHSRSDDLCNFIALMTLIRTKKPSNDDRKTSPILPFRVIH